MSDRRLGFVAAACLLAWPSAAVAVETVTNCSDANVGCSPDDCSLREAIAAADPGEEVVFAASLDDCDGGVILLGTAGSLAPSQDVTITGPGADLLAVDGQNARRVLVVPAGVAVEVSGLTLQHGKTTNQHQDGGAVSVAGNLMLTGVVVRDSAAYSSPFGSQFEGASGGGIHVAAGASLRLDTCVISGNTAGTPGPASNPPALPVGEGGGLHVLGTAEIVDSLISENTTGSGSSSGGNGGRGGGIFVGAGGLIVVTGATLTDNRTGDGYSIGLSQGHGRDGSGAGIHVEGEAHLLNVTLSGNETGSGGGGRPGHGGGLAISAGEARLTQVTVSDNTAGAHGGGIYRTGGSLKLRQAVAAGNVSLSESTEDCSGAVTSEFGNLVGVSTGCSGLSPTNDRTGDATSPLDPELAPLASNGGATPTHLPTATSPAIDAEGPAGCFVHDPSSGLEVAVTADQRGEDRPRDGDADGAALCDAGAVELPAPVFALTAAVVGAGQVTSDPAGIACPPTCAEDFTGGTTIGLTATPDEGHLLEAWSGACTGRGECEVTMSGNRDVTATFAPAVTLSVTTTGGGEGTVSGPGIACGVDCAESYPADEEVVLVATAASGSVFTGWSGACTGSGDCELTLAADATATATFLLLHDLTVSVDGPGSVVAAALGIDCPGVCKAEAPHGTAVTLTTEADENVVFAGWGGACAGSEDCELTLDGDATVTATFLPPRHLAVSVDGPGRVVAPALGIDCPGVCTAEAPHGTAVTLTAEADVGAAFDGWGGDCAGREACQLTLSADRAVTATFVVPLFADGFEDGDTSAWDAAVP